jgi:hypothetical protein
MGGERYASHRDTGAKLAQKRNRHVHPELLMRFATDW